MARARNIKPGFFKNEELALCEHGARLLFAGLWTLADREGRLEDRPLRIKAELFPFEPAIAPGVASGAPDSCQPVASWLDDLASRGFITRYEANGHKYIQVNNFRKHQNPHVKEAASTIPAPCAHHASPADSLLLIPDSLQHCGEDATASEGGDSENGSGTADGYPQAFEEFWLAYPTRGGRRRGKRKCLGIWRQAIRTAERQPLVEAAKHYAASDESTRGYARDPERFLQKEWWRDWLPAIATAPRQSAAAVAIPARIKPANFMHDPYSEVQ